MRLGYRPALDGLRGIAIALVVGFHAFGWPPGGTLGVDLFFVLSGFLITTLLLEEYDRTRAVNIRNFYVRRARRLLPALGAMLAPFLLLLIAAAAAGSFQRRTAVGLGAALTYTSNIVVATDASAVPAAMIHLWSLAAEEQFYIAWPLALVFLVRVGGVRLVLRSVGVLLVVAVAYRLQLALRGATVDRLYYGPDTHADPLLIGCAFGCFFARGWLPSRLLASARIRTSIGGASLTLIALATVLVARLQTKTAYEMQLIPTGFALIVAILLLCTLAGASPISNALGARPLVSLGRISYAVYLWHLPILVAFAGAERRFDGRTVGAVVVAIAAAAASRRLIELPFLRPKRSIENVRPAPAAAAAI